MPTVVVFSHASQHHEAHDGGVSCIAYTFPSTVVIGGFIVLSFYILVVIAEQLSKVCKSEYDVEKMMKQPELFAK